MKMILGIFLGFFLMSQTALAGDATKNESMDDVTVQEGAAEQFEQTLKDSPTASGMTEMDTKEGDMTDQVQAPIKTGEEADMSQEEPMDDESEY
ncbi:hypothetical protein [Alkalimarinus alittae]|uniref:Secreted protein n=1 Tax=Alkalimarinus alittae TaxID=2961619 RepID=A0ABY6N254_9ALTE|nr:hypothetical protein [Alkalimarinus alittae]UZE96079.1 hypothetical protein NKI27_18850 [Alkalimarinus alittae]